MLAKGAGKLQRIEESLDELRRQARTGYAKDDIRRAVIKEDLAAQREARQARATIMQPSTAVVHGVSVQGEEEEKPFSAPWMQGSFSLETAESDTVATTAHRAEASWYEALQHAAGDYIFNAEDEELRRRVMERDDKTGIPTLLLCPRPRSADEIPDAPAQSHPAQSSPSAPTTAKGRAPRGASAPALHPPGHRVGPQPKRSSEAQANADAQGRKRGLSRGGAGVDELASDKVDFGKLYTYQRGHRGSGTLAGNASSTVSGISRTPSKPSHLRRAQPKKTSTVRESLALEGTAVAYSMAKNFSVKAQRQASMERGRPSSDRHDGPKEPTRSPSHEGSASPLDHLIRLVRPAALTFCVECHHGFEAEYLCEDDMEPCTMCPHCHTSQPPPDYALLQEPPSLNVKEGKNPTTLLSPPVVHQGNKCTQESAAMDFPEVEGSEDFKSAIAEIRASIAKDRRAKERSVTVVEPKPSRPGATSAMLAGDVPSSWSASIQGLYFLHLWDQACGV